MSSGILGRTLLDQFRVDRFIASGGMATVYQVFDLKRNVPLAMKVLQEDLAEDPAIFKRFQREADALTRLAHPHIVTFYGLFQDESFAFLLERFIDGPTLKDIIKNRGGQPIPLAEIAVYMKAICSALGYAHTNQFVHCDIKPGNVMIDNGGVVYLADFGIARYANTSTTTLASAGTPAYMAPEQIMGSMVSPATDIYALGVMLFEMLTGRRPFTGTEIGLESTGGTTGERVRYAHLKLQPPDPRSINPALSPALAQVVLMAIDKDPARRFANTQALFTALCSSAGLLAEQIPDRLDPRWTAQPAVPQETETVDYRQQAISGAGTNPFGARSASKAGTFSPPVPGVRKGLPGWAWGVGAGCVLLVIVMVAIGAALILGGQLGIGWPTQISPAQGTQAVIEPTTPQPTAIVDASPVPTQTLEIFVPTDTMAITPTSAKECPGAKPQRVHVNTSAYVCTQTDRLILRKEPKLSASEVLRIPSGSNITIVDGPQCAESSSWWLVKTKEGVSGWVREGSDEVDPYFICPFRD
jgi:serine/threonine protein kinase